MNIDALLNEYAVEVVRLDQRVADQQSDIVIYRELLIAALTRCRALLLRVREQERQLYHRDDDDYSDAYTDLFLECWITRQHQPCGVCGLPRLDHVLVDHLFEEAADRRSAA